MRDIMAHRNREESIPSWRKSPRAARHGDDSHRGAKTRRKSSGSQCLRASAAISSGPRGPCKVSPRPASLGRPLPMAMERLGDGREGGSDDVALAVGIPFSRLGGRPRGRRRGPRRARRRTGGTGRERAGGCSRRGLGCGRFSTDSRRARAGSPGARSGRLTVRDEHYTPFKGSPPSDPRRLEAAITVFVMARRRRRPDGFDARVAARRPARLGRGVHAQRRALSAAVVRQ
jgi:hypothetical protein